MEQQTDLEQLILESAGVALVDDWLHHRASRTLSVPRLDTRELGVRLPPRQVAVPAELVDQLRSAAGIVGRWPMPVPGTNNDNDCNEDEDLDQVTR